MCVHLTWKFVIKYDFGRCEASVAQVGDKGVDHGGPSGGVA